MENVGATPYDISNPVLNTTMDSELVSSVMSPVTQINLQNQNANENTNQNANTAQSQFISNISQTFQAPIIEKTLNEQELAKIEEKNINVEWQSSIENIDYTGEEVLNLVTFDEAKTIEEPMDLENIGDFRQLIKMDSHLLDLKPNQSAERLIYSFVQNITKSIPKGQGLTLKRSILLAYIRSPLFYKYISTGIAALNYKYNRDPTILDKMGAISSDYLNISKFKYAALLTAELRGFASL